MALFKYLHPDRTQVLENLCFRFTPANQFNDPFECLPDTGVVESPEWIKQLEDDIVPELLVSDIIAQVANNQPRRWDEQKIRAAHRARYPQRIAELKAIAHREMLEAREPLRILCLSECSPDDTAALPMWGHYTDSHQGFVVELDSAHEWLAGHRPVTGKPHDAGLVRYRNKRTTWSFRDGRMIPPDDLIFVKSTEWTYEREYRLVRFADTPGVDSSRVDALVRFPSTLISRLILGVNATKALHKTVIALCRRKELAHVRLQQASIHPDAYCVRLNDL